MKTTINILICILFFIVELFAQQTINGTVSDLHGNPLKGVTIQVSGTKYQTFTTDNGTYIIAVPEGFNKLVFEKEGFKKTTVNIKNNKLNIVLSDSPEILFKMSIEELMDVEVVSPGKKKEKQSEAPAVISVLSKTDIRSFGANTLSEILERICGIHITGTHYQPTNILSIRSDPVTAHYNTHVLILLNGRPVKESLVSGFHSAIFNSFPIDRIERIEILRGPASALYGSGAFSGLINIITKDASQQSTLASFSYGAFNTISAQLSTGIKIKELGLSIGAFYNNSDGFDHEMRFTSAGKLYPKTKFQAFNKGLGFNLQADYKGFTFNSLYVDNLFRICQNDISSQFPEWYFGIRRIMTDLGYKKKLSVKYRYTINATYNYVGFWQPLDIFANDVREKGSGHDFVFEFTNFFNLSDKLNIILGALYNPRTGIYYLPLKKSDGTDYDIYSNPENPDPFEVIPRFTDHWGSGYLNFTYSPFKVIKLIGGLHAYKTNVDFALVPRAGVVFSLNSTLTAKLLYGQAYRSPSNFELYSNNPFIMGNVNLPAENVATSEMQISFTSSNISLTGAFFHNYQDNLIVRSLRTDSLWLDPVTGEARPIYISKGSLTSYGGELEGRIVFSKSFNSVFSTSYSTYRNDNGVTDEFGSPNLMMKFGLNYKLNDLLNIGFFDSYFGNVGEFDVIFPDANPELKPYHYATLNLNWHMKNLLKTFISPILSVYCVNLFNQDVRYPSYTLKDVNSRPGRGGFALYAKFKVVF